jgi:hypothetical protein
MQIQVRKQYYGSTVLEAAKRQQYHANKAMTAVSCKYVSTVMKAA